MVEAVPSLALGTAQWGMPYGIANSLGPPSDDHLEVLLSTALELGVDTLDTARAYGTAEHRIGNILQCTDRPDAFRIITKTAADIGGIALDPSTALERLHDSFTASVSHLAPARIDTLLLHRGEHRTALGGVLWSELRKLRERGSVQRIGVSAISPQEAVAAIDDPDIDVIQVAGSLLDQRLARSGFYETARARGVEVHLRGVYLQGLAFFTSGGLPRHLAACSVVLRSVREFAMARALRPPDIWLDYARTLPVDRIVIGTETVDQVRDNATRFTMPVAPDLADFAADLPELPDSILDPSQWPT